MAMHLPVILSDTKTLTITLIKPYRKVLTSPNPIFTLTSSRTNIAKNIYIYMAFLVFYGLRKVCIVLW